MLFHSFRRKHYIEGIFGKIAIFCFDLFFTYFCNCQTTKFKEGHNFLLQLLGRKKNGFGNFLFVFLVMNFIIVINVFFEEAVACFLIQCCKKAKFTFEWCLRELP